MKEEKIFYNELEGSIVAVSPVTRRMKMIQPYGTFEPYRIFSTCQVEQGLFQLSNDNCQVLLPDMNTRKFTIEERRPIPYEANWCWAALVALPGSKVLVIGPKWDTYNLTPWVHDLKENTWSHKLTPDGKTIPALEEEIDSGTAVLVENVVYLFTDDNVY